MTQVEIETSPSETPYFLRDLIPVKNPTADGCIKNSDGSYRNMANTYKTKAQCWVNQKFLKMKSSLRILKNLSNRLGIGIMVNPFGIQQPPVKWSGNRWPIITLTRCTEILFDNKRFKSVPHGGSLNSGSLDNMAIWSWIPCKISAASQSIMHLTFSGSSACVHQNKIITGWH